MYSCVGENTCLFQQRHKCVVVEFTNHTYIYTLSVHKTIIHALTLYTFNLGYLQSQSFYRSLDGILTYTYVGLWSILILIIEYNELTASAASNSPL